MLPNPHYRAIDGTRTRELNLGKVVCYQLHHYRTSVSVDNIHRQFILYYITRRLSIAFFYFYYFYHFYFFYHFICLLSAIQSAAKSAINSL